MEDVKKRGRKKKEVSCEVNQATEGKKKRGRKKKWEDQPIMLNYPSTFKDSIKFEHIVDTKINDTDYNTNNVKFGNLSIQVHDKELTSKELFENKKDDECMIDITSSDDDEPKIHINQRKSKIIFYNNDSGQKFPEKVKCFHCHNFFEGNTYYLPYDHCSSLDRYKLYGCFCSPNCVKAYGLDNKIFCNKIHLIGQFYRKLFGQDFVIKPAPSFLTLKEYGGTLTIEEFRKSFYTNDRYIMKHLNFKVIKIN